MPLPRVVIVSNEHWVRVGLRAELRERGFDAVGAIDLMDALRDARPLPGRGPIGLVLLDQAALGEDSATTVNDLKRHLDPGVPIALIAPGNRDPAHGTWAAVLRRPLSVGDVADYVQATMPAGRGARPLDE